MLSLEKFRSNTMQCQDEFRNLCNGVIKILKACRKLQISIARSTSLYYISLSLGFGNDRHRHPNINIREIIWLGD